MKLQKLDLFESEETPPKASAMINTFRAFGYNLQTAIADIVDNSISAEAKNVWIDYVWKGKDSYVTITDDGVGMNLNELVRAMTPGSKNPNEDRDINDLGRFGLGLKTSSFSQCKMLTVVSKKLGYHLIHRCWDLDYVNKTGKWILLDFISNKRILEKLKNNRSGTIVIWENLDRLVGNSLEKNEAARKVFLEDFERVEEHLSLVFHRYLEKNKLKIIVNSRELLPWDPFMKGENAVQLVGDELFLNNTIHVKCYVLPHISKIDTEIREKAKTDDWYKLQGFYIYRNERLLLYGSWLNLFPKNEQYKNARILIDIPNNLDYDWKIDIKKSTATPSLEIRKDLIRLGKKTRMSAAKIYRFRGNQIMLKNSISSFDFQPLWRAIKKRDGSVSYVINKSHPLIQKIINSEDVGKDKINSLLKLIEETIPIEDIIQIYSDKPDSFELRDNNLELDKDTIKLAELMMQSLLSQGVNNDNAIKQIFNIEPFNKYPELIQYMK